MKINDSDAFLLIINLCLFVKKRRIFPEINVLQLYLYIYKVSLFTRTQIQETLFKVDYYYIIDMLTC